MGDLSIQDLVVEYSSGADTIRPINGLNLDVAAGSDIQRPGPKRQAIISGWKRRVCF